MKYFLDTNILLDLLDSKRSHALSSQHFLKCYKNEEFCLSEDSISTLFFVAQKRLPYNTIIEYLEALQKNFVILPFGEDVIKKALEYCKNSSRPDLEDVLQACCAKENNCDFLVTNDKSFVANIIPVSSVYDF